MVFGFKARRLTEGALLSARVQKLVSLRGGRVKDGILLDTPLVKLIHILLIGLPEFFVILLAHLVVVHAGLQNPGVEFLQSLLNIALDLQEEVASQKI